MRDKSLKSVFTEIKAELTRGDKILIAVILISGLFSLYGVNLLKKSGTLVQVEVAGEVTHILDLNENQTIEVIGPIGATTLKIEAGKAWVNYSDCPEKVCVKTGKISRAGDLIVCVPNKVVVTILGPKKSNFDVITQ